MKIAVVADIHRMAPGGVTCGKRMGGRAVPLFPSGAPGVGRFVDRLGAFLILVGLAGLAVGGAGIAAAVEME